ncbi:MAG: YaiO family outer membrane beta-barrel protein [Deltaproteobacteria bacterium]|nr:YaiO family outer membrane beta-barrel protein [Deltaproteobacteria bacterium]
MKHSLLCFLILLLICASPLPLFSSEKKPYTEIEAGTVYEKLTKDHSPWRSTYLEVKRGDSVRRFLLLQARQTRRFSLTDRELAGIISLPLGYRHTVAFEASGSSSHEVLPKKSMTGRLSSILANGWLAGMSMGKRFYDKSDVTFGSVGIEHYFSAYRLAYTLYSSRVEKGDTEFSHAVAFDRYYGRKSSTGIRLSAGEESENIDGTKVITTWVKGAAFTGRHWLDERWGISYSATFHKQGNHYDRYGLLAGLRYRF